MTADDRMARVEEKLDTVIRDVGELRSDVKSVTNNCPKCWSQLATHTAQMEASSKERDQLHADLDTLYNRLWYLVAGVVLSIGTAIVTTFIKGGIPK